MSAVAKHTTIAALITVLVVLVTASKFAFAAPVPTSTSSPHSEIRALMNISDIIYYAPEPANEFIETPAEVIPKPEPEPALEEAYQEDSYKYYGNSCLEYYECIEPACANSQNGIYIPIGTTVGANDFAYNGKYYDDSWSYTYYPESVLPGGGLDIPGRHVDNEGYICDENGYVCVASDDLEKGTVVSLPFGSGTGVVYDTGSGSGNLDIYTSWP